jgi:hypothetical protein
MRETYEILLTIAIPIQIAVAIWMGYCAFQSRANLKADSSYFGRPFKRAFYIHKDEFTLLGQRYRGRYYKMIPVFYGCGVVIMVLAAKVWGPQH